MCHVGARVPYQHVDFHAKPQKNLVAWGSVSINNGHLLFHGYVYVGSSLGFHRLERLALLGG